MSKYKYKKNKIVVLLALTLMVPQEGWSMDSTEISEERSVVKVRTEQNTNSTIVFEDEDTYKKNMNQKIALGLVGFLGASVTFTLEVLGAIGAFWGSTEVLHIRNSTSAADNYNFECMAIGIGSLALVRYVAVHMLSQHKLQDYSIYIDQASALEGIYKAFESPVPAMKSCLISLFYKCSICAEWKVGDAKQADKTV